MTAIIDNRRKPGRPTTGIGKPVGLRLYADLEAALDEWIASKNGARISRPEAIRIILTEHLLAKGFLHK